MTTLAAPDAPDNPREETVSESSTTSTAGGDATGGPRRRLVIVESPAKARTIAGYLGPDYVVESSIGHIRDLPKSSAEIPADKK
jgi:DNA topoisomerase-1